MGCTHATNTMYSMDDIERMNIRLFANFTGGFCDEVSKVITITTTMMTTMTTTMKTMMIMAMTILRVNNERPNSVAAIKH